MAASAIIAAIGLAVGIGSTVYGISQQNKAKKLAASNIRPTYDITQYQKQNQSISEDLATRGLSESTKQYYQTNAERGFSSGIDAILKGGGDPNAVSSLYGKYTDAQMRLAVLDDERRISNLNNLLNQNRVMSGEADKQWQVNEYGPYADRAQEAAKMYAAGSQWVSQGINTGVSAIGGYVSSFGQRQDINKVNNGGGSGQRQPDYSAGMGNGSAMGSVPSYISGGQEMTANLPRQDYQSYMYQPAGGSYSADFNRLTPEQRSLVMGLYNR